MSISLIKPFVVIVLFFSILSIIDLTPSQTAERFKDNGNGAITDNQTGLIWQKGDSHHDLGKPLSWYDALDYADRMNNKKFAGQTGWRLPTLKELSSLWDSSKPNITKDEEHIGLPKVFASGGSYFLWAFDEQGLDMAWYFGLVKKEDYFNLKEANDLGQGVKLVREE